MLRVLKLDSLPPRDELSRLIPRSGEADAAIQRQAETLVSEVKSGGSKALLAQIERFDGIEPKALLLDEQQLSNAAAALDPGLKEAIETSVGRLQRVSEALQPRAVTVEVTQGGRVTNRFVPVAAAGVYVPGGKASYPSSAIMNVVAAQVAGVRRIVMASPLRPGGDGLPDGTVLATAHMLGVTEFLAAGGAGAISALAYGLPDIGFLPVNAITGPGNKFVAAAKSVVASDVVIDSEAGPTEILVLADSHAAAELVAADLISQAEHDEAAAAVLVTDSPELVNSVGAALSRRLAHEPNRDRAAAALRGTQSAAVICSDWDLAIRVADSYAAEHLALHCREPQAVAAQIRDAGAIFLGANTPVSLGDYLAGSNHVLPTGGAARRSSVLSPLTFLRLQQLIEYDAPALAESAARVQTLAAAEGLPAHYSAIAARLDLANPGEN